MANIAEKEIRKDVKGILEGADLTKLSSKKIRKQLELKYDTDLTARMKEIDGIVMELIAQGETEKDDAGEENHTEATDNGKESESDSDLDLPEDMEPPTKKTKTKEKTEAGLVDEDILDSDDSFEKVTDEQLAQCLQDAENHGRRTRGGRKTPLKKTVKKPKSSDSGKKKSSTYSKECVLSPALAAVMGVEKMKRSDVVKRMWEVVKERDLQDPKNKSFMVCDDELYKVFGRKRVKTFGMMKYLTDHIYTPEQYDECFGSS